MANVEINIGGKSFENFEEISITSQIDSVTSALTIQTNDEIGTLVYQSVEVKRDNKIIFKGEITDYEVIDETPPKPNRYTAFSKPYVLEDCSIPLELYPLQTSESTLKDIVKRICDFYGITLKIDRSASSDANSAITTVDTEPHTKCKDFINTLCTQKGLILTHDATGALIIIKKIKAKQRLYPNPVASTYSVKGRGLYRTYLAMGQQGIENQTAIQAEKHN